MNEFTVASYVFLDDLLKAAEHREDPQRLISDAIVITCLLVAGRYFGGNIEKARIYMKGHHCARMLGKSQLNRRMHRIKGLIQDIFAFLASVFQENNDRKQESVYSKRWTPGSSPGGDDGMRGSVAAKPRRTVACARAGRPAARSLR